MDIMEFWIKYGSLKVDLFKISEIARYLFGPKIAEYHHLIEKKNDLKIKLMIMIIKNRWILLMSYNFKSMNFKLLI